MTSFDFIIVAMFAAFAVIGALRGFAREAMSLVTWVLASVIAWSFADDAAGLFDQWLGDPALRLVAGFVAVFVLVFVVGLIATLLVHRMVSARRSFKLPNLVLGGLIGAARGVVLIVIVFLLGGLTAAPQRPWWREAVLAPVFESLAGYVSDYLPRDVARHIRYG